MNGQPTHGSALKTRRLVILVHGIRTRAEWQSRIRALLEKDPSAEVVPIGYGYFDAFRFLFPFGLRRAPVNEVLYKIRDALQHRATEGCEIIFVGHSFGTYILATILREYPEIRPHRVLLCGSIVKRTFRWDQLPNRPATVLNEAGSRDVWPILAKAATWGYGSTGTLGFQTPGVRDRYHNLAHSDYFKLGFAEKYWVPWIVDGTLESTEFERDERPPLPWYFNVAEVAPLKYLVVLLLVAWTAIFVAPQIQSAGDDTGANLVAVQKATAELPAVHVFVAEAYQRYKLFKSQSEPSVEAQRKYADEVLKLQSRRYAENAKFVALLNYLPSDQATAIQDAFNRYLSVVEALMAHLESQAQDVSDSVRDAPESGGAGSGSNDEVSEALDATIDEAYKQTEDLLKSYARYLEREIP